MIVEYSLQNARGEQVSLNNWDSDMLSYTPTGLGVAFTNTYNQYDAYFKASNTKVNQGQMGMNILFGQIESQSYTTFSTFATFLAYQPLTLTYISDSGTWKRDARVSALNKSEIGGGVSSTERLNESFTLDFINPWYNNKIATYKSYNPDKGLETFGKGFFNTIDTSAANANSLGQYNLIPNSELENTTNWAIDTVVGSLDKINQYNNSGIVNISAPDAGWHTVLNSDNINVKNIPQVSASMSVKVTSASSSNTGLIYNIRFFDANNNEVGSVDNYADSNVAHDWKRYSALGIIVPEQATSAKFSVWVANQQVTASVSEPMMVIDAQIGDYAAGKSPTGKLLKTYAYALER